MDISFTSEEDEDEITSVKAKINTSDLYYDTNKSGGGKPIRTLEHPKRTIDAHSASDITHIRNGSRHRGRKRQYTQTRSKSAGKKSFDDILSLINHSNISGSRRGMSRHNLKNLIAENQAEENERYLNDYLRQKEHILRERAHRLLQMGQISLQNNNNKSRMTIDSTKKTNSSYNRGSQQHQNNKENRNNNNSYRSKSRTNIKPEYAWMDHAKTYNYVKRKNMR